MALIRKGIAMRGRASQWKSFVCGAKAMKCLAKKSNGFEESCLELQWKSEDFRGAAEELRRVVKHGKGKA